MSVYNKKLRKIYKKLFVSAKIAQTLCLSRNRDSQNSLKSMPVVVSEPSEPHRDPTPITSKNYQFRY